MGLFSNLGQVANVPTITRAVETTVRDSTAAIGNYVTSNFNLPSIGQLQGELSSKLASTGLLGGFKKLDSNYSLVKENGNIIAKSVNGLANINVGTVSQSSVGSFDIPVNNADTTTNLKVKISQMPELGSPNEIIFTVMPRIDENGSAEYEGLNPLHHPGTIQKYRYSPSRTWSVSGRLISRNVQEATTNLELINMMRSWRVPFYGEGTANDPETADKLGAPPPILTLSAYGPAMIGPVKTVLTSYNWTWDPGVDWIPTANGNPFPVIIDVSLSLVETWSPAEYSGFNLMAYKMGDLSEDGAFKKLIAQPPAPQQATLTPVLPDTGAGAGRGSINNTSGLISMPVSEPQRVGNNYHDPVYSDTPNDRRGGWAGMNKSRLTNIYKDS